MPYKRRIRGKLVKICEACSKSYNVEPSRFQTARFCTVKCTRSILGPLRKGKVLNQNQRNNISKALIGKYRGEKSPHWRGGDIAISCGQCSLPLKIEKWRIRRSKQFFCSKKCRSLTIHTWTAGSKNNNWKGGITPTNEKIRKSLSYKEWRKSVFVRDDFRCQSCGMRGVKIHADHIKPFCRFTELRFELSNGRTLCVPCHRKTDTWGSKALAA